jgi:DNA polymerase-3 subunit epsilon
MLTFDKGSPKRYILDTMSLDFTAIDFETANGSPASPCAVGLVKVRDGKLVDGLATLITPPPGFNYFSPGNIQVHGIRPSDIDDAPTWEEVLSLILAFADGDILIAHNAMFDMGVLKKSAEAIQTPLPQISYACTLEISRKTYNLESYRLNSVAYAIGHEEFKHHDALADADACARIMVHAADRHGVESVDELLAAVGKKLKVLVTE